MKKLVLPIIAFSAIGLTSICQETVVSTPPPTAQLTHIKDLIAPRSMRRITSAMREKAAIRQQMSKKWMLKSTPQPGGFPNYFGPEPNYANSPLPKINVKKGRIAKGTGIRKFVDSLPGLGADNKNNLGQYIPVAIPDTTTFSGSDYYELAVVEYSEKLHSDLGKTRLRGYIQQNTSAGVSQYLGPMIIASRDRPVRVKFTNLLPTGSAGNLFLPVDTSVMGAGYGPNGPPEMYTQNRAVLHLHGGATPWISDGTPHQWITPAGETTSYPQGASVVNVPDMPNPGSGASTYYFTNQQSSRLMFYHDHSYGSLIALLST